VEQTSRSSQPSSAPPLPPEGTADAAGSGSAAVEPAATHDAQIPEALRAMMMDGWAPSTEPLPTALPVAAHAAKRRTAVSAAFPSDTLVVPTGGLVPRANDTDHPFRAGSDYAWLVGDLEPDGVLVLTPASDAGQTGGGHEAVVYVPARSDRTSTAFFTDRRHGELWVGPRWGVEEVGSACAVTTAPRSDLVGALAGLTGRVRVLRGRDAEVDAAVAVTGDGTIDGELATALSELRLIKDDLEVAMLQQAVDATVTGFTEVARELGAAQALPTGERWLEGTFWRRARTDGNDVGYGSIVACGHHATTLHWVRDDGPVRDGELLLLDMGVESRALYTADVTRTLPVSGRFTPAQRRVYDAVHRAQRAGLAAVAPGVEYLAPHRAAMRVLAAELIAWGLLDEPLEDVLKDQLHQRWTLHGTSHHLGLDVHDCAAARSELYRQGTLRAGMVITVEPGLYFQRDDERVPTELRGIGVRIEDDVLVTEDGARVLSAALPTAADEVEAWVQSLRC